MDHQCEDRRPENYHHVLGNSNALTVHPLVNLPKTWIEFKNENVKILGNKIEFVINLKKHLLGELSSVVSCGRLLCPSCHLYLNVWWTIFCNNVFLISVLLHVLSWVPNNIQTFFLSYLKIITCSSLSFLCLFVSLIFQIVFLFIHTR